MLIRFLQGIGFTLPQIKEMHEKSAEEIKTCLRKLIAGLMREYHL